MPKNKNFKLGKVQMVDLSAHHNSYGYDHSKTTVEVRRVIAKRDFVASFGYKIPKGTRGGFVQNEQNIAHTGWVADDAVILGDATVYGIADGHAIVMGDSMVFGKAHDECVVKDKTVVHEDATVTGNAIVSGDVWLAGKITISGVAHVHGRIQLAPYPKGEVMCINHDISFDNNFGDAPRVEVLLNPDCAIGDNAWSA